MTKRVYYGFFLVMAACVLLSVLYCPLFDPGGPDQKVFAYGGWALSKGLVPYRDFFDHKPPLIYFINLAGILLGGPWGLWTIETLLALLSTGLFFKTCRQYKLPYPWLLPLLFNLMVKDYLICTGSNTTREYTSFFFLLFFCALVGSSRYRHFLLGLLTGLVFFTQQDQVLPLLPFLLYALLAADPLPLPQRILRIGAGFSAVLLPLLLYFAIHRSLGYFWKDAFLFNFTVYTAEKKSMGDHFRTIKRVLDAGNYELPFMIACCLGITALVLRTKKKGLILAAFAGLLLSLSAEFIGGRTKGTNQLVDFYYYFMPLSAAVSVLLFAVFAYADNVVPASRAARLPFALLLCSSLTYTALQHATHLTRSDQDPVINSPELNYLRQHRPGNYQLYIVQNGEYICTYYEFRILSPSPWIYQHFWSWYPDWDPNGQILQSIGQDLLRHHTTYVIMDAAGVALFRNPANYNWWMAFMKSHYQPVPLPGSRESMLWRLKDMPN